MNKALAATQKHFESSCSKTPEYLAWHRLFKREFTKFLAARNMLPPKIGKPNHFDISGFFDRLVNGRVQIWYFRIEDLRWSKDAMLIRKAQHYKDYTGGHNQYIPLTRGEEAFSTQFDAITSSTKASQSI